MEQRLTRIEDKLDKIDQKLDNHMERLARAEVEIAHTRGSLKLLLSGIIAIATSVIAAVAKYLLHK